MAANVVPLLARIAPVRYRAGLLYWHTHRYVLNPATGLYEYPPDEFYFDCPYRFSGKLATPPRAMWYAGSSPSCSLWETVLRDVYGDADGFGLVLPKSIAGRRLTALRSRRELAFLELMPSALHKTAGGPGAFNAWHALTITPEHADTHAPTAALLAAAAAAGIVIDGFVWHSRQSGGRNHAPLACALFQPPTASDAFEIDNGEEPIALDDGDLGDRMLQRALADAGLQLRFGVDDEEAIAS